MDTWQWFKRAGAPRGLLAALGVGVVVVALLGGVVGVSRAEAPPPRGGAETTPQPEHGPDSQPVVASDTQAAGLTAQVVSVFQPGANPRPPAPPPALRLTPVPGIAVQALPWDGATAGGAVASGVTDERGEVTLDVPPGRYLIVAPWPPAQVPGGVLGPMLLPNGENALVWAEATYDGAPQTIELRLTLMGV